MRMNCHCQIMLCRMFWNSLPSLSHSNPEISSKSLIHKVRIELLTKLNYIEYSGMFLIFVMIRGCSKITLINICAFIFQTIEPNPPPMKNWTSVQIPTKSWFSPILNWSLISTAMIFGAANYNFLESLGPGQYNKIIFKMFYNCLKDFCTSVNIEMLYRVILYVTYS